jgi:Lamin Tail Domain/Collagen triple helix repeat (20 copies)
MHSSLIRSALVVATMVATATGVGVATNGQGSATAKRVITACAGANGQLRVVESAAACGTQERTLRWTIPGVRGVRGAPGPAGPAGPTGVQGAPGADGAVGADGASGPEGPRGVAGLTGATGADGAAGARGPAGAQGSPGPAGAQGSTGPVGAQGLTGAQGSAGLTGTAGAIGPVGLAGPTGPPGATGLTGAEGAKGDPGPTLASFDQLGGLACAGSGVPGTIQLAYDSSGHVTLTCLAPPSGSAVVRVNEVATGTSASGADEFVELANTGTASADIGGWKLVYRSATGTTDVALVTLPASTTLAAGGFYLLGGASYGGAQPADQSFSPGLASPGGAVGLRDGSGTLVDSVGWGTATNALVESAAAPAPPATAAPGSSIQRLPNGHDTNNNATDFTVTASPSPRASNH